MRSISGTFSGATEKEAFFALKPIHLLGRW